MYSIEQKMTPKWSNEDFKSWSTILNITCKTMFWTEELK